MKPIQKRPDTPLASTPEPMPVTQGQIPQKPVNKYQATADAAIQQIKMISQMNQPQESEQPQM